MHVEVSVICSKVIGQSLFSLIAALRTRETRWGFVGFFLRAGVGAAEGKAVVDTTAYVYADAEGAVGVRRPTVVEAGTVEGVPRRAVQKWLGMPFARTKTSRCGCRSYQAMKEMVGHISYLLTSPIGDVMK